MVYRFLIIHRKEPQFYDLLLCLLPIFSWYSGLAAPVKMHLCVRGYVPCSKGFETHIMCLLTRNKYCQMFLFPTLTHFHRFVFRMDLCHPLVRFFIFSKCSR